MQEFSQLILPNGIRCVHRRVKSAVAHIAFTINAGTRDESSQQHGVAHLVEHMLFKGTTHRTAYAINNRLESVGGELNAYTTKEETVLHASCLAADFTKGTELLSDMIFNSTYLPHEIEKEKEVIIDEINSYKDNPSELIFDDFEELLFEGSAIGRNILGSPHRLRKISRSKLIDFTTANYNTDQMVFSASSPLTHAQFATKCQKILENIPANKRNWQRQAPGATDNFKVSRNKKTYQTHTVIGGRCYSLFDSRRIPFSLLLNILGGQSSLSRLNQSLREKHALTYNIEANYTPYTDCGVWAVYFSTESDKHQRSTELIMDEIEKLKAVCLSDNQLKKAKRQFLGQLAISSENNESLIMSIAKSLLIFDAFDTNEEIAAKINSLTAQELHEAANDIFQPSNINTLIYG